MASDGRSDDEECRGLVGVLTAAGFLIFAQAFMIAPILPRLSVAFGVGVGSVGLAVPAYLIPYGLVSLIWGPVADRYGRRPVIQACLAVFVAVTAVTVAAPTVGWFIGARAVAGAVASGVIPVGVALVGDLVPYRSRGRALGWLFAGMAGGMAVGSTVGALGEPVAGWRGLFVVVAVAGAACVAAGALLLPATARPRTGRSSVRLLAGGYGRVLRMRRARRAYAYVAINAVVSSGIYTWLGVYLRNRFGLGPIGIGLALLGYGLPGFAFGPVIGRAADRYGRARLIPAGVAVSAVSAFALAAPAPLAVVTLAVAVLSLGYDLTQPLLAGIVTDLPAARGQAVALMAVVLFCGFGAGSLLFQAALRLGFAPALTVFGVAAAAAAAAAVPAFTRERTIRPPLPG